MHWRSTDVNRVFKMLKFFFYVKTNFLTSLTKLICEFFFIIWSFCCYFFNPPNLVLLQITLSSSSISPLRVFSPLFPPEKPIFRRLFISLFSMFAANIFPLNPFYFPPMDSSSVSFYIHLYNIVYLRTYTQTHTTWSGENYPKIIVRNNY